jgi:hypothetical protein
VITVHPSASGFFLQLTHSAICLLVCSLFVSQ